jgi:hypothetical protein
VREPIYTKAENALPLPRLLCIIDPPFPVLLLSRLFLAVWRTHSCVQRSHSCERLWFAAASHCVGRSAGAAPTSACATESVLRSRLRTTLAEPRASKRHSRPIAKMFSRPEAFLRRTTLSDKQHRGNSFHSTLQSGAGHSRVPEDPQRQPRPFFWTKSAGDILNSIARICRRTNHSGH